MSERRAGFWPGSPAPPGQARWRRRREVRAARASGRDRPPHRACPGGGEEWKCGRRGFWPRSPAPPAQGRWRRIWRRGSRLVQNHRNRGIFASHQISRRPANAGGQSAGYCTPYCVVLYLGVRKLGYGQSRPPAGRGRPPPHLRGTGPKARGVVCPSADVKSGGQEARRRFAGEERAGNSLEDSVGRGRPRGPALWASTYVRNSE